jgi:hypothetical protein
MQPEIHAKTTPAVSPAINHFNPGTLPIRGGRLAPPEFGREQAAMPGSEAASMLIFNLIPINLKNCEFIS